jgi:hypothetical protein
MASKTEIHYLSGKVKWVRAHTPNAYGDYKLDLYPTNESLKLILEWKSRGLKNMVRKDDDGETFVSFKRPASKTIRNKVVGFAPPEIVDKNGDPVRDIQIGNGSDCTIKVAVYTFKPPGGGGQDGKTGIAARLEAIRIDNLVPFNRDEDYLPPEQLQVGGLAGQPQQKYDKPW